MENQHNNLEKSNDNLREQGFKKVRSAGKELLCGLMDIGKSLIPDPKTSQRLDNHLTQTTVQRQYKQSQTINSEPIKNIEIVTHKIIVKQSVILVFFVSNPLTISYLQNLHSKQNNIDNNDIEKLYQLTQYLSQVNTDDIESDWNNITNYKVEKGEECQTDIFLIKIDLTEPDERFKQNRNQIDRINAFRNLPNIIKSVEISERLKMNAGVKFSLYSR